MGKQGVWVLGGRTVFGQKLMNPQSSVERCALKSPIMNWANALKRVFKKISLKPNTASHNTTSWYTNTNGFLEHTQQEKPVLQGASPPTHNSGFLGSPLIYMLSSGNTESKINLPSVGEVNVPKNAGYNQMNAITDILHKTKWNITKKKSNLNGEEVYESAVSE